MKTSKEKMDYCKILTTTMRTIYERIGTVHCPVLKEGVAFNARGFHHLLYNSDGTPRDVDEIIYKLTLVPLVKHVITNATGIHEERDVKIRESRKKNAKIKNGKTYSITALVGRKSPVEIRVILLRIGNGKLMFRSVMKH